MRTVSGRAFAGISIDRLPWLDYGGDCTVWGEEDGYGGDGEGGCTADRRRCVRPSVPGSRHICYAELPDRSCLSWWEWEVVDGGGVDGLYERWSERHPLL